REDAEDLAEGPERPRGLVEGRPPGTRIDSLVDRAAAVEQDRDRLARVEVIRHRGIEIGEPLRRRGLQRPVALPRLRRAAPLRVDRAYGLPQTFVRPLRLIQQLLGDVDRAAR